MENWQQFINLANFVVLAAVPILIYLMKGGLETAVKGIVERAIQQAKWPEELRQELEKSRGVERQELRFKSYGTLWSRLRPLAIYSNDPLGRDEIAKLSDSLSDWYFSECGGMLMTSHIRELYFTLQDLAQNVGNSPSKWQSRRPVGEYSQKFKKILTDKHLCKALTLMENLTKVDLGKWPSDIAKDCAGWRTDIEALGKQWCELDDEEKFVTIQQVSSVLRSCLTYDVDSRLR